MANEDRIKVVGYAQRVFFNDGIEYRNFTDDLVGNQQTEGSDGATSTFTFGNFVTTTNFEGRTSRIFSRKKYGNFYTLENLNLDGGRNNTLLNNNVNVTLNVDKTDLCNFAYFGSATEFVRVSLENIITNWPASLYLTKFRADAGFTVTGETVENYTYDGVLNKSTFRVDTNFIVNKFDINYKSNGTIINTFNETNDLRNMAVNFDDYVILVDGVEYDVIGFTGSTTELNDYIYFDVLGNPFDIYTRQDYHIKPKSELVEQFFNGLDEFESYLLNRKTLPIYTSEYTYKVESETGVVINTKAKITWPVNDGYNIDFDTADYVEFVSDLLQVSNGKDGIQTNLMARFLTSDSISDFDTIPRCDGSEEETAGQKMNKTLKIYGREFDEIKKYIDGISYANVVTYDKKKNTPDQLVKYLARTLGWELTTSIVGNNLIDNYLKPGANNYPGYSIGLTPAEAEVEMWRRLILNSAFLFKAKGTRKAIEFLFSFVGVPDGLADFTEYIYKVKEPIDMNFFNLVLENNELSTDLTNYLVDSEGYPSFNRDTEDMYFQKGGKWYRETAGTGATQYVLEGNNPHVGPYDGGKEYIYQLENLIPSFSAFTLTSTTVTSGTTNLFTNYAKGLMNQYSGQMYVTAEDNNGVDLTGLVLLDQRIIDDPCPTLEETDCGCDVPEDDQALIIDIQKCESQAESARLATCEDKIETSQFSKEEDTWTVWYKTLNRDGQLTNETLKRTEFVDSECCDTALNSNSFYYEDWRRTSSNATGEIVYSLELFNAGNICCRFSQGTIKDAGIDGCGCKIACKWNIVGSQLRDRVYVDGNTYYIEWTKPDGHKTVVNEADSCFCPTGLSSPRVITDPYSGKPGYACMLNTTGIKDLAQDRTVSSILRTVDQKISNTISCKSFDNTQYA